MDANGESFSIPNDRLKDLHGHLGSLRKWKERSPASKCMYWQEECGNPVRSHSLSKCWLRMLAVDNHVLQLKINVEEAGHSPVGMFPVLKSIKLASVFRGFCSHHDNQIFRPVDTLSIAINLESCLLLAYRAICHSSSVKFSLVGSFMSKGDFLKRDEPNFLEMLTVAEMRACIDLLAIKCEMERAIDNKVPTSQFEHYVISFNGLLPFTGSSTFKPKVDAFGRALFQDNQRWVSMTVVPTEKGGVIFFTWEKPGGKRQNKFISSLSQITGRNLGDFILSLVLEYAENVAFSPEWWNKMTPAKQLRLRQQAARSIEFPAASTPRHNIFHPNPVSTLLWRDIEVFSL